jgi:Ca2+-binding EF-hand superfamily protein
MGPGGSGDGFPGGGGHGGRGGMGGLGGMGPRGGGPRAMEPIKRGKFDKAVAAMFALADANRDGQVTVVELQGLIAAKRETLIRARFQHVDRDNNGSIDFAEFSAWQAELGSVALSDEAAGGRAARVASVVQPPLDKDDRGLGRLIEPLGATTVLEADANSDGAITLQELLAYEGKRFEAADKNHDGEISPEELRASRGGDSDFPDPRAFGGMRQP